MSLLVSMLLDCRNEVTFTYNFKNQLLPTLRHVTSGICHLHYVLRNSLPCRIWYQSLFHDVPAKPDFFSFYYWITPLSPHQKREHAAGTTHGDFRGKRSRALLHPLVRLLVQCRLKVGLCYQSDIWVTLTIKQQCLNRLTLTRKQ